MTQFEIPQLLQIYDCHDNYEILTLNPKNNLCIIYFSSHNIYFPNTAKAFREQIIDRNRFEWKKNILSSAKKIIFIRDIKKQWYLEGINQKINTIDKLYNFLKKEVSGEVVCIGSSAGGYVATLIGCLLKASRVLCFSGQFSLLDRLQSHNRKRENPILVKYKFVDSYAKYYSLVKFIRASSTPVFYFYPAKCKRDIKQAQLVEKLTNVFSFAFDVEKHGVPCYPINLVDLMKLDCYKLKSLHQRYEGYLIQPFRFSVDVSGFLKTSRFLIQRRLKRIKRINSYEVS